MSDQPADTHATPASRPLPVPPVLKERAKAEEADPRVDDHGHVSEPGTTANPANGCVPTLQEIQRRDGVGVAEAMRRQHAETPMCLAQEWVRDGRGLWAMRACQYYAIHNDRSNHGKSHAFGSWRYNVQPPAERE